MKALLANIDLMVRVLVPDDATKEQIIAAIVDKCQEQSSDRSWFGEGIGEITDDEVMPYGTSPNDHEGKKLVGYQIESTDGKHDIPEGLYSFEVFPSTEAVEKWSDEHQLGGNWTVVPIYEGDIEDITYIN